MSRRFLPFSFCKAIAVVAACKYTVYMFLFFAATPVLSLQNSGTYKPSASPEYFPYFFTILKARFISDNVFSPKTFRNSPADPDKSFGSKMKPSK